MLTCRTKSITLISNEGINHDSPALNGPIWHRNSFKKTLISIYNLNFQYIDLSVNDFNAPAF